MPFVDLPLILVTRRLDQDVYLGQGLHFPEVLALHDRPDKLHPKVGKLAGEIVAQSSPVEVHRRVCAETPLVTEVTLDLQPPVKSPAWVEPLPLRFHVLRWRHGDQGFIAYVPALDIHLVAARENELDDLVPRHVRFALGRLKLTDRLFELMQLDRVESVTAARDVITPDVKTPRRLAAEQDKKEPEKPVIHEVGYELKDEAGEPAFEIDAPVDRVAQTLTGRNARSVLLVGPSGVGKTAAFKELFRRRRSHHLAGAPFWMTSGARLVAGQSGFGMWQERAQRLARESHKAGAIVHLGNLVELMEVGKAAGSNFGIASFLRPAIARGDFLAVAECTPEQLPLVEKSNPHLLGAFDQVRVEEPPPDAARMILLSAALEWQAQHAPAAGSRARSVRERGGGESPITDEALDALDRLHRRYATYSAGPGRPLRFLRNLLQDRKAGGISSPVGPVEPGEVTAAFSRETGLPLFLLDDHTPLDLGAARAHFAARVIGQGEAVDLVTDLLATVKAALNRPRRPIASFLFIGPTGVGKTEMAKALAEFFFGDRTRLVRFDMSEYASAAAVARLVGAAWETEGLLTSKVREQPFCVVLLDEFEKADASFFDLLLQVLGEGRLTDSAGRLADFSNAIVIMTSNLGAQTFQSGPFGLSKRSTLDAREHFTEAVRSFLRPEMFNRIDRVVPFLPLEPETIRRIASRELALIGERDGVRLRELSLNVSEGAAARLARDGYDVLYGARPLKRTIERDMLAALADAVNQYGDKIRLTADVDVAGGDGLSVNVRAISAAAAAAQAPSLAPAAGRASSVRRRAQAIARCPAVLDLHNHLFQLQRLIVRKTAHPGQRFVDPADRERVKRLTVVAGDVTSLVEQATAVEDELLLHVYESAPLSRSREAMREELARLEGTSERALLMLYSLRYADPHRLTIALYAESHRDMFALALAYRRIAIVMEDSWTGVSWYSRQGKHTLQRNFVDAKDTQGFLASPRQGVIGLVLDVNAPFAAARFEDEAGLHVFEEEKNRDPQAVLVDTSVLPPDQYKPPKDVEFRAAGVGQRRRTYVQKQQIIEDATLRQEYRWVSKPFEEVLARAIEDGLRRRTQALLEA